jgi:hypothetical protein
VTRRKLDRSDPAAEATPEDATMPQKDVVIFVHGIGQHAAGWSQDERDGPVPAIKTAALDYPHVFPESDPAENRIEFLDVRYDDILDCIRSQWHELARDLASGALPQVSEERLDELTNEIPGFVASIADATDEDAWYATHAADAVMYAGFPLIRQVVRYGVAAQLANIVAERLPEDVREKPGFTIVAHSLGTAVAYDAIQLMGTTNWLAHLDQLPGGLTAADLAFIRSKFGTNPFAATIAPVFDSLIMVANVTGVLCRNPSPHSDRSVVRPKFSGGFPRSITHYLSFDHILDPVTKISPFTLPPSWSLAIAQGTAEEHRDLRHVYDANIHGFAHYLRHPRLHARIFWRALASSEAERERFTWQDVLAADARVGQGDFSNFGGPLADDVLRDRLEQRLLEAIRAGESAQRQIDRHRAVILAMGALVRGFRA